MKTGRDIYSKQYARSIECGKEFHGDHTKPILTVTVDHLEEEHGYF